MASAPAIAQLAVRGSLGHCPEETPSCGPRPARSCSAMTPAMRRGAVAARRSQLQALWQRRHLRAEEWVVQQQSRHSPPQSRSLRMRATQRAAAGSRVASRAAARWGWTGEAAARPAVAHFSGIAVTSARSAVAVGQAATAIAGALAGWGAVHAMSAAGGRLAAVMDGTHASGRGRQHVASGPPKPLPTPPPVSSARAVLLRRGHSAVTALARDRDRGAASALMLLMHAAPAASTRSAAAAWARWVGALAAGLSIAPATGVGALMAGMSIALTTGQGTAIIVSAAQLSGAADGFDSERLYKN